MIQIVQIDSVWIDENSDIIERSQLQYHEYKFIENEKLLEYFKNKTIDYFNNDDFVTFGALLNGKTVGFISVCKDSFDSEIFGFDCFRIVDFMVFSKDVFDIEQIIEKLLLKIENELRKKCKTFYIAYSLNNNIENANLIFNNIVKNKFYYIHTLLTFYSLTFDIKLKSKYPEQGLIIRTVNESDVEDIAELAYKSIKFSRFHMDPFLDKNKSNILLKTSAENSILEKFVDIMFVAELNGKVVGYYSAKKRKVAEFNKIIGDATLSIIDANYRGLGIFSKLDSHLLKWFSENTDFAEMGTYLANYPVHKTWIGKNLGMIRGVHQFSRFYR